MSEVEGRKESIGLRNDNLKQNNRRGKLYPSAIAW
jgi:hypothetical protein